MEARHPGGPETRLAARVGVELERSDDRVDKGAGGRAVDVRIGARGQLERQASLARACQPAGKAADIGFHLGRKPDGAGLLELRTGRSGLAHALEDARQLQPGAVRLGTLGEQVAERRGGAGEVAQLLADGRQAKPRLGAKLRVLVLGERLEDLRGAGLVSLLEERVGQCEHLFGRRGDAVGRAVALRLHCGSGLSRERSQEDCDHRMNRKRGRRAWSAAAPCSS